MKFSALLSLILLTATSTFAQIDFFHGTWEEALTKAKAEEKLIFVDAYAEWCGPCKRMAKNVFTNEKVGEFHNSNFINLKIDMEKGMGLTFRRKYPVSAFPTLFYIDSSGEVVHKVKGAQQVDGLIKLGKFAMNKVDYSKDYAAEYEKGSREPELMYKYVKALNKSKKSSLKITNEYLRTQKKEDLTNEFNLRFIHEGAVEADSRVFKMMVENKKEIGMLVGLDALNKKIETACQNTVNKGIEYEIPELLDEAKLAMRNHYPARAENFGIKADLDYYFAIEDHKNYLKTCGDYAKKVVNNNPKDLDKLAKDIESHFGDESKCMKIAEKYAKEAAESNKHYAYYLTYAHILNENGKKSDALEAANKSLELAKNAGRGAQMAVQKMIQKIES